MSGELVEGEQSGPEKIISNKQWHPTRRKSITQNAESLESRYKSRMLASKIKPHIISRARSKTCGWVNNVECLIRYANGPPQWQGQTKTLFG